MGLKFILHINFVSCEVVGGGQLGMGDLTNGGEGGLLLFVFLPGFMSGSSGVGSKNMGMQIKTPILRKGEETLDSMLLIG